MAYESDWVVSAINGLFAGARISKDRPLIVVCGSPFLPASLIIPQVQTKAHRDHKVRSQFTRITSVTYFDDYHIYAGILSLFPHNDKTLEIARNPTKHLLDHNACTLLRAAFAREVTETHHEDELQGDICRVVVGILRREIKGKCGRPYRQYALAKWLFDSLLPSLNLLPVGELRNLLSEESELSNFYRFEVGRFHILKED